MIAEEIVPRPPEAAAPAREAPPSTPAPAETGPSRDTRMALAERLLNRPPHSLEEADEALARAGFVFPSSRKP